MEVGKESWSLMFPLEIHESKSFLKKFFFNTDNVNIEPDEENKKGQTKQGAITQHCHRKPNNEIGQVKWVTNYRVKTCHI